MITLAQLPTHCVAIIFDHADPFHHPTCVSCPTRPAPGADAVGLDGHGRQSQPRFLSPPVLPARPVPRHAADTMTVHRSPARDSIAVGSRSGYSNRYPYGFQPAINVVAIIFDRADPDSISCSCDRRVLPGTLRINYRQNHQTSTPARVVRQPPWQLYHRR